jgi:hypothetical protein
MIYGSHIVFPGYNFTYKINTVLNVKHIQYGNIFGLEHR